MIAKYLIDVNLPRKLALWRGAAFVFVADIDAAWRDQDIWDFAAANMLTIVTKDADFTVRAVADASGPHVIHMRVGNMKIRALHEFLQTNWAAICVLSDHNQLVTVFEDHVDCIT